MKLVVALVEKVVSHFETSQRVKVCLASPTWKHSEQKMNVQSRNQSYKASPPDKGSFPLDHKGVCDAQRQQYVECMQKSKFDAVLCKSVARFYFQCRMDK